VKPRFTLNLGLRYEPMSQVTEANGNQYAITDPLTSTGWTKGPIMQNRTYWNFGPRVGFAWDLTGSGKTALRGGAGIYYDIGNFGGGFTGNAISGLPNIALTLTNPTNQVFTFPFNAPTVAQALTNGIALNTTQDFAYHVTQPLTYQYNLTLQRQLPGNIAISVAYVGTQGEHLWQLQEANPIAPTAVVNGVSYWSTTNPNCQGGTLNSSTGTFLKPTCRANPNFGTLVTDESVGVSSYNSLQVVTAKRLSHGLQFQVAYTYGNALSTPTGELNGINCVGGMDAGVSGNERATDYGPSCTDVRHNIRTSALYYFPSPKSGFLAKVVGGWYMGHIVSFNTGLPFSPYIGSNRSDSGNRATGSDRPNVNIQAVTQGTQLTAPTGQAYTAAANFVPYNPNTVIIGTPNEWFNVDMFSLQPFVPCPGAAGTCSTLGNVGRGILRGPGLVDWDFSLVKDTRLTRLGEGGLLQFRAEFFNLLNHPNFATPAAASIFAGGNTSALAGAYSQAPNPSVAALSATSTTSRQIQFALKLIF
jgi:hypothetical protein